MVVEALVVKVVVVVVEEVVVVVDVVVVVVVVVRGVMQVLKGEVGSARSQTRPSAQIPK